MVPGRQFQIDDAQGPGAKANKDANQRGAGQQSPAGAAAHFAGLSRRPLSAKTRQAEHDDGSVEEAFQQREGVVARLPPGQGQAQQQAAAAADEPCFEGRGKLECERRAKDLGADGRKRDQHADQQVKSGRKRLIVHAKPRFCTDAIGAARRQSLQSARVRQALSPPWPGRKPSLPLPPAPPARPPPCRPMARASRPAARASRLRKSWGRWAWPSA